MVITVLYLLRISFSLSDILYIFFLNFTSQKKKKNQRTKVGNSHSNSVSHPSILEQLSVITRSLKLIKVVASKSQFVIGIAMATVTRLHIFPQSFDHYRTGQPVVLGPGLCRSGLGRVGGRNGLCLKLKQYCRSFKGEEGGEVEEKEAVSERKSGNLKKSEAKLERGSGFWKSFRTTILGGDEYDKAVAKVEEVFFSVSCLRFVFLCFKYYLDEIINLLWYILSDLVNMWLNSISHSE